METSSLLEGLNANVRRLGVIRTYMVRHGPGPFPTYDSSMDRRLPERHNESGGWQGPFCRGALDLVLLRYAGHADLPSLPSEK